MTTTYRIELADDIATVSADECVIDVVLHVDTLGVCMTLRAKIDRERDTVSWTPERILSASWDDGTEVVVDRAFCPAEWELRLREHNEEIESFARSWMDREEHAAERERFLDAGFLTFGLS